MATAWVSTAKDSIPATWLKKPGESPWSETWTEMLLYMGPPGQLTMTLSRS